MGRPLNKRYFKTGPGNQLKVRAKIGTSAEGEGFIITQKSSRRYKVNVGGEVAVCNLVVKADGTLLANEVTIEVVTDGSVAKKVSKLTSRHAVVDGVKSKWNFSASTTDGAVQASDATDPVITISVDPASAAVVAPAGHTFTVTAGIVPTTYTLKYRWAISADAGVTWTNLTTSGVYTGATAASLVISDSTGLNGMQYRVAVSATGVSAVNSAAATLTVS